MDSDSYLVVDIDNVVAYTDKVMRDVIRNHSRETVELRYEDVKHFNYWECADSEGRHITRDEWNSTIHPAFSEQANILRIEPYREVRCFLCRLINAGYRIHLATSRLKQARVPTLLWLDEYRIPHDALHFVKHGTKHIVFRTCVAIIEDDLDQARKFAEQGIQSYVLAHPWNDCAATENVTRVQNWHEIVDDLTQQISYVQTGGSGASPQNTR
jgi:hypothetical protein